MVKVMPSQVKIFNNKILEFSNTLDPNEVYGIISDAVKKRADNVELTREDFLGYYERFIDEANDVMRYVTGNTAVSVRGSTCVREDDRVICNEDAISAGQRRVLMIGAALALAKILKELGAQIIMYIDVLELGLHADYVFDLLDRLKDEEVSIIGETHHGLAVAYAVKNGVPVYVFHDHKVHAISIDDLRNVKLFEEERMVYEKVVS